MGLALAGLDISLNRPWKRGTGGTPFGTVTYLLDFPLGWSPIYTTVDPQTDTLTEFINELATFVRKLATTRQLNAADDMTVVHGYTQLHTFNPQVDSLNKAMRVLATLIEEIQANKPGGAATITVTPGYSAYRNMDPTTATENQATRELATLIDDLTAGMLPGT